MSNYKKRSTDNLITEYSTVKETRAIHEDKREGVVDSEKTEREHEKNKKMSKGVVAECVKLNVRKEPKIDADVLIVIPFLSDVQINENDSTGEWLSIKTPGGVRGFCMSNFIKRV